LKNSFRDILKEYVFGSNNVKNGPLLRSEDFFLEIGHKGYKKIENFTMISKMSILPFVTKALKRVKVEKLFLKTIKFGYVPLFQYCYCQLIHFAHQNPLFPLFPTSCMYIKYTYRLALSSSPVTK
jgi:hypothetical protein